jgi:hypothetical protein
MVINKKLFRNKIKAFLGHNEPFNLKSGINNFCLFVAVLIFRPRHELQVFRFYGGE